MEALLLMSAVGVGHKRETKAARKARLAAEWYEQHRSLYLRVCEWVDLETHGFYDWILQVKRGPHKLIKIRIHGAPVWIAKDYLQAHYGLRFSDVRIKKVRPVRADFGAVEVD